MKKGISIMISVLMVVILLFGCNNQATNNDSNDSKSQKSSTLKDVSREKTLIWAVPSLPNGADNEFQYTAEAQELERNLYDSPLAFEVVKDKSGFLIPDYSNVVGMLAEEWSVSPDGRELTFKFREGVMSHDGNELTADDFIYKWQRGFNVNGNTATFGADSQQIFGMDQIEKVDNYTIKLTTKEPNPIAETFLTHVAQLVLDGTAFQSHQTTEDPDALDWASTNAAGHGPWKLVEFTPGKRVVLDRFDDYWDKDNMPWFERVIILEVPESSSRASMVLSGDVDAATKLSVAELKEIDGKKDVKTMHYDGNKTFIVGFNHTTEEFSNPLVKRAMSFAIPYDEILEAVYMGVAKQQKSLIPSTYPDFAGEYWKYSTDYEQAKTLLAEAGYPNGFDVKLTIENTDPAMEQTALLIQSSLKKVGINMQIEKLQTGDYYNKLSAKDFESMYAFIDSAGVPDAGFGLQLGAKTKFINNMGHYSNAEVDELIEKMMSTNDKAVRTESAKRIQEIIVWEDPYAIYIAEPGFDLGIRSDIVNPKWDTIQQIRWNYMSREE